MKARLAAPDSFVNIGIDRIRGARLQPGRLEPECRGGVAVRDEFAERYALLREIRASASGARQARPAGS